MNVCLHTFLANFADIVVPVLSAIVFLCLARYVAHIGPMRTLVTGQTTYRGAAWGFALGGLYFLARPIQVLMGDHPAGLLLNNLREFLLIGVFAPTVFVAMLSLCLGDENFPKWFVPSTLICGTLLGVLFVWINTRFVGGSERFFAPDGAVSGGRSLLTLIRLVSPTLLLFISGGLVFYHARHYPDYKGQVYNNMPRKLYFLGSAVYVFAAAYVVSLVLYHQSGDSRVWWLYYVGSFLSGILETVSLSLPLRREVQISEHM